MKKIILLIVVSTFSLFSCSEGDDSVITQSSIVGKWQPISLERNGKSEPISTCQMSSSFEFSPDNTYLDTYSTDSGTPCVTNISNGKYSFTDNILILTETGTNYTLKRHCYVRFITPTKFTFRIYNKQEGDNNNYISESNQGTITLEKVN